MFGYFTTLCMKGLKIYNLLLTLFIIFSTKRFVYIGLSVAFHSMLKAIIDVWWRLFFSHNLLSPSLTLRAFFLFHIMAKMKQSYLIKLLFKKQFCLENVRFQVCRGNYFVYGWNVRHFTFDLTFTFLHRSIWIAQCFPRID